MDKETIINNLLINYGKYGVTQAGETPDDYFKLVELQRATVYYFPNGLH